MKKFLITLMTVLCAVGIAAGCAPANTRSVQPRETVPETESGTQTEPERPIRYTLTGTGRVKIAPDTLSFQFGVDAKGETLAAATEALSQAKDALVRALQGYGTVQENYRSAYPDENETGYRASVSLSLRTTELDAAEQISAAITANGATRIYGTYYECTNAKEQEAEAIREAVRDAERKAAALGEGLHMIRIAECCCYPMNAMGSTEELYLETRVQVTFGNGFSRHGRPHARIAPKMPREAA